MTRKMKRYNVENRALKFIEQDKMPIAPKHPSTVEMLESITKGKKKFPMISSMYCSSRQSRRTAITPH
jgi:Uncharacterised protein family (UPF0240).